MAHCTVYYFTKKTSHLKCLLNSIPKRTAVTLQGWYLFLKHVYFIDNTWIQQFIQTWEQKCFYFWNIAELKPMLFVSSKLEVGKSVCMFGILLNKTNALCTIKIRSKNGQVTKLVGRPNSVVFRSKKLFSSFLKRICWIILHIVILISLTSKETMKLWTMKKIAESVNSMN